MRRCALVLAVASACTGASSGDPDGGAVPDGAGSDAVAPAPLVVVTLNLRCLIDDWEARLPLVADGLAAAAPDVIGLEEVCLEPGGRDALEALVAALDARGVSPLASARTVTHRAWDAYDEGLAILSRHPIGEVHVEALPPGAIPRKVLVARIERDGHAFAFATTHLDHQDAAVRARQAAAAASAVAAFAGVRPRVLVGDLNEGPGGGVSAALAANAWTDAWVALHPGDPGPTFPASSPTARIDYVWSAGGLAPQAIERTFTLPVAGVHASDHLGLRAVLVASD